MASDADVLAQGRLEVVRRQHWAVVSGLFWGAVVLALLTVWAYVGAWEGAWVAYGGLAVLTGALLCLAAVELRAGLAAGRDPASAGPALRRRRRHIAFVVLAVSALVLILMIWLASERGVWAVFGGFSSGVLLALVGLGAAAILLGEPGPDFQDRLLRGLAARSRPLAVVLAALGVVLIGLGIWAWADQGLRPAFPEVAGAMLLGLVLLGGALYLTVTPAAELTPTTVRGLVLTVGGVGGLVIAVMTIVRAVLWWNEVFAGGVTAWRGEGGWRLWVCFYVEMLGLAIIFASLLLARADIRVNPVLRRLLFGYNAVLTGLLLLAVLVVFNVTVYAYFPYTFEWTKTAGLYSLSDKTKNTLGGLTEPVTVYVLMSPRLGVYDDVRTLMQNMQAVTNRLRVDYVSPDLQIDRYEQLLKRFPKAAAENLAGGGQGLLLVYGADTGTGPPPPNAFIPWDKLSPPTGGGAPREFNGEKEVITELSFLARPGGVRPVVYFTQGRGELNVGRTDPGDPNGDGLLGEDLRKLHYDVRALVWGPPTRAKAGDKTAYSQKGPDETHKIPDDALAVVLARPFREQPGAPYPREVLDALGKYLDGKGKLIVLANVQVDTTTFTPVDVGLRGLLRKYGVDFRQDYVFHFPDLRDPNDIPFLNRAAAPSDSRNPVAQGFKGKLFHVQMCRTVRALPGTPYHVDTVLQVSADDNPPAVWAETELRTLANPRGYALALARNPARLEEIVSPEPLPVGAAVSSGKDEPKLVVFGDATLAWNALPRPLQRRNYDLIASSLAWLEGRPDIGIEPRKTSFYNLPDKVSAGGLVFLPTGLILLGLVATGAGVWVVRRR